MCLCCGIPRKRGYARDSPFKVVNRMSDFIAGVFMSVFLWVLAPELIAAVCVPASKALDMFAGRGISIKKLRRALLLWYSPKAGIRLKGFVAISQGMI